MKHNEGGSKEIGGNPLRLESGTAKKKFDGVGIRFNHRCHQMWQDGSLDAR